MRTLPFVLLAALSSILASEAFANRTFISAPYNMSFLLRPGPSLDEASYASGGIYFNRTDIKPETQWFGRMYDVTITNLSKIPQRMVVTMVVAGVSWKAPTPTKVGALFIGPNFNVADEGADKTKFTLEGKEFEVPAESTIGLKGNVNFFGKTKYAGIYFSATASVGFKFDIKDDRGAITAALSSSPSFSMAGNNGSLTSQDTMDATITAANFSHFNAQMNGGRPF